MQTLLFLNLFFLHCTNFFLYQYYCLHPHLIFKIVSEFYEPPCTEPTKHKSLSMSISKTSIYLLYITNEIKLEHPIDYRNRWTNSIRPKWIFWDKKLIKAMHPIALKWGPISNIPLQCIILIAKYCKIFNRLN